MAKKATETKAKTGKAKKIEEDKVTETSVVQSIEKKLIALYTKQKLDKQVDDIRIIRGELPLEVQDIEDEIKGLETRLERFKEDIENINLQIQEKAEQIVSSKELIAKYQEQQMNVRNNREYDSITKELNYQKLEIQLAEKRIDENKDKLKKKKDEVKEVKSHLKERKKDLTTKKKELKEIVSETEKEEIQLKKDSEAINAELEERLAIAYERIRLGAKNGLAVVKVERDACGGCFSKIPPQRQLDIRTHKKIIVCEYCGRILIDDDVADTVNEILKK
ncbi:MAG: hypothetical protein CSA94_01095 [Bacteroidetes bacterium]|nr:MAG: hypothetical protein CSA94_01095 [Bacteroidota bacterium]